MRLDTFLRQSETTVPAVVVSGCEVALGVVRDLGRERVPVLSLGAKRHDPAFGSRYCTSRLCCNPRHEEDRFIEDLEAVGRMLPQRAVLFPAEDDFSFAVSRHKERLEKSFIVTVPPWEHMWSLADKERQLRLAWQAGVETPITAFIHGPEELAAAADAVPFPALLKPAVPRECFRAVDSKVVRVASREQLGQAYELFSSQGPFLLQEIIPGGDEEVYIAGSYHDAQTHCVALFTGRKLRQHPRGFGVTRLGEARWSAAIAELTVRLLAEARYQGVSDVEFKRDPRDGGCKFMEINPRAGYWIALARASGVNLTYIAYRDAIGQPCPECRQRDGVCWSDMLHDGPDSLRELRRDELSLGDWLGPLMAVRTDAFLSLRDPQPGLQEIGRMAMVHARKGVRRIIGARETSREVVESGPKER
jgi:predicted ATP-grasp superfamily ATP-dependent carboligase